MFNLDLINIKKRIPNREPFLFVDKILYISDDLLQIKCKKKMSKNDLIFQGHFSDYKIVPGVIIIEAMSQCGGLLISYIRDNEAFVESNNKNINEKDVDIQKNNIFLLRSITNTIFRKQVLPDETLIMDIKLAQTKIDLYRFIGDAFVNGAKVCSSEFFILVK